MVGGSTDVGLTTQRGARCEWGLPGGAPLVTLAPLVPGPAHGAESAFRWAWLGGYPLNRDG